MRLATHTTWVKTENLQPAGCFQIQVLAGQRSLAPITIHVEPTSDWQPVVIGFNSLGYDKVRIYAGVWGGKAGRFWLDSLGIEEVGLVNVLRRSGTPLVVRDETAGTGYEEGRDFAPIADPKPDFHFDHAGPALRLLPGSRIHDGQALRVSYYHGMAIHDGQVTVCWYYQKRNESLKHFSSLGFKTLAGAYYDGDTLENPKGWLEALERTPGAIGIMYTTWQNKYELLGPFGDLLPGR